MQGHRAQPLAQQRRPLAPRRARGGAQGAAAADPRPPQPGRRRRGHDLQHRRLRRVRRPRRDGRPHPHLRALVEPRQPSVRGARDRPDGQGSGARHRPRAAADLARPQADAERPVAAGARELPGGRRRAGHGDEGRHVRRLRRDPAGRRGSRPHLRARAAPRREPARDRLAGRQGQRPHPRGRRRPAAPLALAQAGRGRDAACSRCPARRREPPALGLSDEVFADEVPAAEALEAPAEEEPAAARPSRSS